MNGAVYISFFQGQLESVLEQVVQLAVQEISKTVGASLNSMLLETAVKDQDNQRLKQKLQSREIECKTSENGSVLNGGKADNADSARTKPEQHTHPPSHCTERGVHADTRRLEQKGRVVGQLKTVMEQVLDFAVCELSKIVEASFDDLLLEITAKEREQHLLEEKLRTGGERGDRGRGGGGRGGGRRRGSENDSTSPSGSEVDLPANKISSCQDPAKSTNDSVEVLSVSQDWVPILDKVFGQKWCSDLWQVKGQPGSVGKGEGLPDLEPSPRSPPQDPRWTPLEDMEVLSHEEEPPPSAPVPTTSPGPAPSPSEDSQQRSASMLHRLLTLPAQLLDDDDDADAEAMETLAALAEAAPPINGVQGCRKSTESPSRNSPSPRPAQNQEEEEEVEEEEEERGTKRKRRKVWVECEECGQQFSRRSLLRAHQQTHSRPTVTAATPPPSPGLPCSECGKKFSKASRLQTHLRTQHSGKRP